MAVIHISEADAARELSTLLDKVRAGDQVEIVREDVSFMIVPVAASIPARRLDQPRLLSEVLAGLEEDMVPRTLSEVIRRSQARGSELTLDSEFGNDVEEGIRSHEQERLIDPWESF